MFFSAVHLPQATQADRYHEAGLALLRQGRIEDAVDMFQRGVACANATVQVLLLRDLGLAFLTAHRYAEALQVLFDLLRLEPDDQDTLLRLGDCYLAGGDVSAAEVFYWRAESLSPESPKVRARLTLTAEAHPGPDDWFKALGFPLGAEAVYNYLQDLHSGDGQPARPNMRLATSLLYEVLQASDPASVVRDRLDEVLASLPDLIALTASQAESEGDLHRAQALAELAERANQQGE